MAAVIPLKIITASGEVHQFASTEAVSADGIEPRSGSTLTLGGTSTSVLNLTQGAGADTISMFVGTTDPSAGSGVAANPGSVYFRNNSGAGEVWTKTAAGNTAWSFGGGGGSTLQAAYTAGNTISVATSTVSISNSTDVTNALTIDRTFIGGGAGLVVTMGSPGGAAVAGRGISVTMGSGSTNAGILVTQTGVGAGSQGIAVSATGAGAGSGVSIAMGASTTGVGLQVSSPATAAGSHGILITQSGITNASARAININISNASSAGDGITIANSGTGKALSATTTNGIQSASFSGKGGASESTTGDAAVFITTSNNTAGQKGAALYVTCGTDHYGIYVQGQNSPALYANGSVGAAIVANAASTGDAIQVKDGGTNVLVINGSGAVAYTPTSGQSFTVDVLGAGVVSIDVAAASNFTVSGATADLTLGARAGTITLNQTGQTTLTGFTATSLVGALNELKAGGGWSIAKDLVLNATQTGTSPIVIGAVYLTNAVVYGTSSRALIGTSAGGTATLKLRRQSTGVLLTGASWAVTGALADVALGSPITVPATDWYTIELLGDAGGTVSLAYGLTLVI